MKTQISNLTEKVSVNINTSTLAAIDMLVDHGYYSNRSDFINQALREAVKANEPNIANCSRNIGEKLQAGQWFMGLRVLEEEDLDKLLSQGKTAALTGYGVLYIGEDIPQEKLFQAVRSVQIKGKVICPEAVRSRYGLGG